MVGGTVSGGWCSNFGEEAELILKIYRKNLSKRTLKSN
jgi:hypothetical protein